MSSKIARKLAENGHKALCYRVPRAVGLTRGDAAYMLVIVWAFVGIAVKHAATPLVATAAWVMTGVVVLMLVASVFLRRRSG